MHLSAVNLHNWCPSSISTSKISHVTENGQWLGVNKKGNHTTHIGSFEWKGKKRNTTNNEDNGGEIKLELLKIIVIATTVAMKMTMGKILSDNNNDSTNKKMKSWSFRRQYLRNINTSLYNNNARLCVLELNRCAKVKDISTSSVRTIMHSTEMDQGSKDDFLRIWNVVWNLGYIRCRYGLKLYAGKCDIWYTMKIISKINSTCMSWILLHEEAPARSLKISLIRRDWIFLNHILIHHWETILTAIWLIDRIIFSRSKLCFLVGKVSQFSFTLLGSMYVFLKVEEKF